MNVSCNSTVGSGVVHVVVPDAIDDPLRPSGGNRYDRKVCDGLVAVGWQVCEHKIPDAWPELGSTGGRALARLLPRIPDGAVVLVDGLIAVASAEVLVPAAHRVSLVVLVHATPDDQAEAAQVFAAARCVIATSDWLRVELLRLFPLPADAVAVARPGVEQGAIASGTPRGRELLCVGAIAPHKGHDVLLAALAELDDQSWHCRCVGSLDHDRSFADQLCLQAHRAGLTERVTFTGPLSGRRLDSVFAAADVLVHPARVEGYGMVVTEALSHGLPVITTTAGGLVEAVGTTHDGEHPGLLVMPGDAGALAQAISTWLGDAELRRRLRHAARSRRSALTNWSTTTQQVAHALEPLP